jgi:hypothetical protein
MKNPFLSLWLSAANKAAGTARGLWLAEARRQQAALAKKPTKRSRSARKAAPKRGGK